MKNLKRSGLEMLCLAILGVGIFFYLFQSKPSLQKRLVNELTKRDIPRKELIREFEYRNLENRFEPKISTLEAKAYKWDVDGALIGYRERVRSDEISIPPILYFYAPEREELRAIKVKDVGLDGLNKKVYTIVGPGKHLIIKMEKTPNEKILIKHAIVEERENNQYEMIDEKDIIYQVGDQVHEPGWSFDEQILINGEWGYLTEEEKKTVNKIYNQQIKETIKDIQDIQ